MSADVEALVAAKICWAWDDGCPIAAHDTMTAAEMTEITRRRWNSFPLRNKNIPDTTENRINDLAGGLGPLISDYRWQCEQIAPILTGDN